MMRSSVDGERKGAMPTNGRLAALTLSLLAIAVLVNTARYLGSTTLGVFWAVTVVYAVGMIAYHERRSVVQNGAPGIARRVMLPLLSASTAAGVLAWTVAVWGRTWTAIIVALAAGLGVHVLVGASRRRR